MKYIKTLKILSALVVPILIYGVTPECDSTLFKNLIEYSEKHKITNSEFLACKTIVDTLDKYNCDFFIRNEKYIETSLTYLFGKICYKANNDAAIKAYLDYHIKHIGSAEEQISFSFENLFYLQPKLILDEILINGESIQKELLTSLVWGFLNNRCFGINDPYKDNPFKAMTHYENTPEPILNKSNYREIFYKVYPITKQLYPEYQKMYEYMFSRIEEYFDWLEDLINKRENE